MLERVARWSSGLLILSGILVAGAILFLPDVEQPGFALMRAWKPVHFFIGVAALLMVAGLGLFYRAVSSRISVLGHIAFFLAMLGNILVAGLSFFVEATIVPVLARDPEYEALLSISGPLQSGAFGTAVLLSLAIFGLGTVLLAGYLASARMISFLNGFLFIGALFAGFVPPFPTMLGIVGGVLLGAGTIWLGISIRSGIAHKALAARALPYDECLLETGGHA